MSKILDFYSISDFTFEPINEGIANTSFVIESNEKKYVLRVYIQDKDINEVLLEISFQDYLRSNNIPIPKIYLNIENKEITIVENDGLIWQCILMDYIEGQSVTIHPSKELSAELANFQAKMHVLGINFVNTISDPTKLSELHDSLALEIKKENIANNEVIEFIDRARSFSYVLDPKLPCGYNHLDIDFDGNVITKNNHVAGIIDFDDLKYSPSIVCLGYTLWNILDDEGIDAMFEYLSVYEKVRTLTSLECEALPHVILFRNYVIGIIRLLSLEKDTDLKKITDALQLEKEIPKLKFQ